MDITIQFTGYTGTPVTNLTECICSSKKQPRSRGKQVRGESNLVLDSGVCEDFVFTIPDSPQEEHIVNIHSSLRCEEPHSTGFST